METVNQIAKCNFTRESYQVGLPFQVKIDYSMSGGSLIVCPGLLGNICVVVISEIRKEKWTKTSRLFTCNV